MISAAQLRQLATGGASLSSALDESERCLSPESAPWAEKIAGHLDWVLAHSPRVPHPTWLSGRPLPFERVLAGFVDRAAEQIVVDPHVLQPNAFVQLERWLLERLVGLSSRMLELECSAYRAAHGTAFEHLVAQALDPEGRSIRNDFEDALLAGGLVTLALEYPTWARLLSEVMGSWRAAVEEFLARLTRDRPIIFAGLCGHAQLAPVTRLLSGVSDPHDGGRSVIILRFASGHTVVYKPRDVRTESAFSRVADWLAARGTPAGPRTAAVVECDGYGWMEFTPAAACRDRTEVADYYRRAGGLLCLAHALCGTDCHFENIIASGPRPVLVDAETLLQTAPIPAGRALDAVATARAILNESVFSTAMLPVWRVLANGSGYDNSGLGVADRQRVGSRSSRLSAGDTQDVEPSLDIEVLANVPRLDGAAVAADDYISEIIAGFSETYRALLAHRDAFCAEHGPLEMFSTATVRVVLRPTQLYGDLITGSLRPRALQNGAEYWRDLRAALDASGAEAKPPRLHVADPRVLRAELRALEHLDIPRFSVYANRPIVAAPPELAGRATGTETGLARTAARLRAMSDADLHRQVSFIRGAFHCRAAARTEAGTLGIPRVQAPRNALVGPVPPATVITRESAERLATTIAGRIHDLAIFGADGTVTWIVPAFQHHGQRYQLRPMGLDLYGGTSGVALFLAALSRITGEPAHRELALAAIKQLPEAIGQAGVALPVGGLIGIGSAVYTLVTLARLLDRPDLVGQAIQVARLIDRAAIERDQVYDITTGSAGATLALLALARVTRDEQTLDAARACADHVVAARAGTDGWSGIRGRLTGCAHGAAGIAHALARVAGATGDARYLDAAGGAVAFEEELFDAAVGNWPDLRRDAPEGSFMLGWCSGAPGVGLARLSSVKTVAQSSIDVERAARATQTAGLGRRDHLCCGNFGRAAFLFEAARQLDDHELHAAAANLVRAAVDRAETSGTFALVSDASAQADHVGFFQGTAGIGFQLLRFAYPDLLPSPLLIE